MQVCLRFRFPGSMWLCRALSPLDMLKCIGMCVRVSVPVCSHPIQPSSRFTFLPLMHSLWGSGTFFFLSRNLLPIFSPGLLLSWTHTRCFPLLLPQTQTACTGLHGHGALQKGANANILFWNFLIMGRQRICLHACWGLKGMSRCLAFIVCIQYAPVPAFPFTISCREFQMMSFLPVFILILYNNAMCRCSRTSLFCGCYSKICGFACLQGHGRCADVTLCYIKRKIFHKQGNSLHSKFKQMCMITVLCVFV